MTPPFLFPYKLNGLPVKMQLGNGPLVKGTFIFRQNQWGYGSKAPILGTPIKGYGVPFIVHDAETVWYNTEKAGDGLMSMWIEGCKRVRKNMGLRWHLAGLNREKNRMIFLLGQKALTLFREGELGQEVLREECQGVETIEQEMESTRQELSDIRTGHSSMTCQSCGEVLDQGCQFCPQCGEKVAEATFCPHCSNALEDSSRFCPQCGTPRENNEGVE